jgi:hypothetical protein
MGVLRKNMIALFSKRTKFWHTKSPMVLKRTMAVEAFSE